ncbi:MAG: hypothetical protein V1739_05220 [Candidatus Omnitrophota bacterium]
MIKFIPHALKTPAFKLGMKATLRDSAQKPRAKARVSFIFFLVLFMAIAAGAFAIEFEVTGIIFQKEPIAIINGKIVKVGDEIDGAIVQKIFDKSVFLKYKGDLVIKNVSGKRPGQAVVTEIEEKLDDEKPSKSSFFFYFIILILMLGGVGFYLFSKSKNDPDKLK